MQQGQFYADVAEDVVKSCLDGFNGTVFAYGQTGAGKSWSMEGSKEEPGIQARAMRHLFDAVEDITKMHPEQTCLIRVSYLEIYNDMVHDLLGLAEGSPGGPHHDDHQRRRTTKHHHGEDGSADARRPTSGSRKASSSSATADKASWQGLQVAAYYLRTAELLADGGKMRAQEVVDQVRAALLSGADRDSCYMLRASAYMQVGPLEPDRNQIGT